MKCKTCGSLEQLYNELCYACFSELHEIVA